MAQYKLHKVNSLPGTPENNSLYFVKEGTSEFNMYVTDISGTVHSLSTGERTLKVISSAADYPVVAEDYTDKILVFDADTSGADINIVINDAVAASLTDELIIYSAANHVLNFTAGTGITLKTTAGNLLKSANDGDSIAILGVKPLLNLTTFAVYGTLEFTLSNIGFYDNQAAFPATGEVDYLYVDKATSSIHLWNGSAYESASGGSGVDDKNFLFDQPTPSATWVITHNLNKYPSPIVFDSANTKVEGDVTFDSLNQITITFSAAFSGKATLN